jgi:ATP-dependent exoDNAse (exonuclease V) beta subunit
VDAATSSPAWQAVAALPSARRELTFTRVLRDGATINGALDLATHEGGVAQILDVKTTAADDDKLAERYAVQAAVYSDAVRAIAGVQSIRCVILSVPSGGVVETSSTTEVASLVNQLRSYLLKDAKP